MIETMFMIILSPIALVAGVFTLAFGFGVCKGLVQYFKKK